MTPSPIALWAHEVPRRAKSTLYPPAIVALLATQFHGREKRPLGDAFHLTQFGVNLTRLAPQALSALHHAHSRQDEFIYILQGTPTLYHGDQRVPLAPGMCAGFKAGTGEAHHLVNETQDDVLYLEIGDRSTGDEVTYPDHDLAAVYRDGTWTFLHKDGTPY